MPQTLENSMRVTRTTLKMFFQRSPAGQESAEALLEGLRHKYPRARIGGKERWKLTVPLGRGAFTIEQVLALLAELDLEPKDLREVGLTYRMHED